MNIQHKYQNKTSISNQLKSIAIFFILSILTSCGESETPTKPEAEDAHNEHLIELTEAQFANAEISIGSIEQKTLSNTLKVSGMVDAPPQNLISISAPLGGYVVSTDLVAGMKVKKGQRMLTLEHQDYIQMQQDYLDKKSQLDFLEKEYNRQQKLHDQNVNSDKVLQQTTSQYKSMKAQVNGLKEKLAFVGINASNLNENSISRRVTIYAPANGYISKLNVNIGKYCNPTDVLIELINTEHLHAELTVYEKDLGKIAIGQHVRMSIPTYPNSEVEASIYLIGKSIEKDRSIKVHAHFSEENENLIPGMYINANIEMQENKVNAVRNSDIVSSEGKNYIVISDGIKQEGKAKIHHFRLLEIEKGVSEFDFTEVTAVNGEDLSSLKYVSNGAYAILAKLKNSEEDGHGHGH